MKPEERNKYFIQSLVVNADISQASIQQALFQLDFDFLKTYTIGVGRKNLACIPLVVRGVVDFVLKLDEDLEYDWYIIDESTKRMVVSKGAA